MTHFVRTPYGLMPADKAKQFAEVTRQHEAAKKQTTEAEVLAKAGRLGLKLEEVKAMWRDGPAVVERAMRRAVARIPRAVLEKAYPCAGCKKVRDDQYKADCERAQTPPCFMQKMLRGCERFERAPVVG